MSSNPLCLDIKKSSENCSQSKKKMGSSVLEQAIKVRKPYTITKQRERWTEDEHNKFLEALKLYGRAWRQIEEHVGTKTAVQIRSHAQKFFTKVVRESASENSGEVKTIEIPPPRHKRKPMHPYPRKLGNSPGAPVMEKQEWSLIPKLSVSEQDNMLIPKLSPHEQDNLSPTSVLSAAGSDTFGSSASDLVNSCTSPISSVVGSDLAGTSVSEPENGCQSATTSVEDDDKSSQHIIEMELDMGTDPSFPYKEVSSAEAPASTLKLFGKTVVVADPQKPLCSTVGVAVQCREPLPDISQPVAVPLHKQNVTDGTLALPLGEGRSQWHSWPSSATPMFCLLSSHGNLLSGDVPMLNSWAFCGGAALPMVKQNLYSEQEQLTSCRESSDNGDVPKDNEGLFGDSNSASSVEASIGDRSTNATTDIGLKFRPSERSAFRSLKATPSKPSKGFVPYRRCVAEKNIDDQKMGSDKGEGQGVQLCL